MKSIFSRRSFLALSAKGVGAAVISSGLMGCNSSKGRKDIAVSFDHGVASGDPLTNAVILWTRITPVEEGSINVAWEVATDSEFNNIINNGNMLTSQFQDYTVKIDAINLSAGSHYYYRFKSNGVTSPTGQTTTLPEGNVNSVKFAVLSCANYPAGYFNVYQLATTIEDIDAVLHLGDYIYEYARDEYASKDAKELNRQVLPEGELFSLADYRVRYGQYRTDSDLQSLHQSVPFITVWDDHEIANDTYQSGAENHNDNEGSFDKRKVSALQAYFEWLPIRPLVQGNELEIYRHFKYGDLVDLFMLDTRVLARDLQLDYKDYFDPETANFDHSRFEQEVSDQNRVLLGTEQLQWLEHQLSTSTSKWQLLGQQVLMGDMYLPAAIVLNLMSLAEYSELGQLAHLAALSASEDTNLTTEQQHYLNDNKSKLTPEVMIYLQLPSIPYNLDAWDGYQAERERIFKAVKRYDNNLIVLAGDTHNAWCNELKDQAGNNIGVEFATSSVSSPGLEYYLGISQDQAPAVEQGLVSLIKGLKYCNLHDRGLMTVLITHQEAIAQWHFIDSTKRKPYEILDKRSAMARVEEGTHSLTSIEQATN